MIGAVGSYAASKQQSSQNKENLEQETKAEMDLAKLKRQWQLQDRQYNQNAVGNWAKFLDPRLVGGNSVAPATTGSGNAPGPTAPAKDLATTDANGSPIVDPNNPLFAANPVTPGTNVIPINHPAMFQGMSPQSASAWTFAAANPDYDFFNPNPDYQRA